MSEPVALKPCPFCGETEVRLAYLRATVDCRFWRVECVNPECDCSTLGPSADTDDKAIAAWNKRAATPAPAADDTSDLIAALNACPDIMHARIQPIAQRETEYVLPASLKFRLLAALLYRGASDAGLRAALQDIADAEPIPTDADAFLWCRDVARAALANKGDGQ